MRAAYRTRPEVLDENSKLWFASQMTSLERPLPFNCLQDDDLLSWRSKTFWTKEPETLAWLRHNAMGTDELHFIDVGANIGLYSLYALSLSTRITVTSIEPSNHNFPTLKENIELNRDWARRVTCLKSPLSAKASDGFWAEASSRVGDSGHQFGSEFRKDTAPVRAITGDSIVESLPVNTRVILKIDVDGHELQILEGFRTSFRRNLILSVLVELEPRQRILVEKQLEAFGYLLDTSFDNVPGHSSTRRQESGSLVRNYVFSLQ